MSDDENSTNAPINSIGEQDNPLPPAGDGGLGDAPPAPPVNAPTPPISTDPVLPIENPEPPVNSPPVVVPPVNNNPIPPTDGGSAPVNNPQPPDDRTKADKFLANMANWRQLLQKVYANRKQKRLNKIEKVFAFAQKKGSITKKDVQLLMRCGHDSALDYLDALVAQNSLRRVGGFHQKNTRYEVVK